MTFIWHNSDRDMNMRSRVVSSEHLPVWKDLGTPDHCQIVTWVQNMTHDIIYPTVIWNRNLQFCNRFAFDSCGERECERGIVQPQLQARVDEFCPECPWLRPAQEFLPVKNFSDYCREFESQGRGQSSDLVLVTLIARYLTQPQTITSNKALLFWQNSHSTVRAHFGWRSVFLSPLEILELIIWEVVGDFNLLNALLGAKNCI